MKNENLVLFHFSFLLKTENSFGNLFFKIPFSFFYKNENENFWISLFNLLLSFFIFATYLLTANSCKSSFCPVQLAADCKPGVNLIKLLHL